MSSDCLLMLAYRCLIIVLSLPRLCRSQELVEPSFISKSDVHSVVKGDSIELPCKFDKPTESFGIVWSRDDQVLFTERVRITNELRLSFANPDDPLDYTIKIDKALPGTDDGVYVCLLNSDPPKVQKQTLTIYSPPVINIFPEKSTQVATLGSSLTLTCQATGNPPPTVTWSKLDGDLPASDRDQPGQLVFKSVTEAHKGTYKCTGDNGIGRPVHVTVDVQIVSSASDAHAPRISVTEKLMAIKLDHPFNVTCFYTANPDPSVVEWFFDGYKLDTASAKNSDRVKLVQEKFGAESGKPEHSGFSALIVGRAIADDYGNYTCRVVNAVGKSEATIYLSGRPEIPSITLDIDGSGETVVVKWTVHSLESILHYQLDYKKESDKDYRSTIIPAGPRMSLDGSYTEQYKMEQLEPDTTYVISVKAQNSNGWGRAAVEQFRTGKHFTSRQTSGSKQPLQDQPAASSGQKIACGLLSVIITSSLLCLIFQSTLCVDSVLRLTVNL